MVITRLAMLAAMVITGLAFAGGGSVALATVIITWLAVLAAMVITRLAFAGRGSVALAAVVITWLAVFAAVVITGLAFAGRDGVALAAVVIAWLAMFAAMIITRLAFARDQATSTSSVVARFAMSAPTVIDSSVKGCTAVAIPANHPTSALSGHKSAARDTLMTDPVIPAAETAHAHAGRTAAISFAIAT